MRDLIKLRRKGRDIAAKAADSAAISAVRALGSTLPQAYFPSRRIAAIADNDEKAHCCAVQARGRSFAFGFSGHRDERDGAVVKAANAAVVLLLDDDQLLPTLAERQHQPAAWR